MRGGSLLFGMVLAGPQSGFAQSSVFDPHTSNHPRPHLAREKTEALQSGMTHPGLPKWYGVVLTSGHKPPGFWDWALCLCELI